MHPLWAGFESDVELLLRWKLDPNGPKRIFFGLRWHPIHETCKACKEVVDFPRDRLCPVCSVENRDRNPLRQYHNGLDLPVPAGTPLCLPFPGVVSRVWFDPKVRDGGKGGGNSIIIRHTEGPWVQSGYCHLERIEETVKPKTYLDAGEILGTIGETGDATGPHLHLTAYQRLGGRDAYVDPLPELLAGAGIAEIPWHPVG